MKKRNPRVKGWNGKIDLVVVIGYGPEDMYYTERGASMRERKPFRHVGHGMTNESPSDIGTLLPGIIPVIIMQGSDYQMGIRTDFGRGSSFI